MSTNAVVIVGAGQGGYQVAASLREEWYAGCITLVGEEPGPLISARRCRTAYLLGKATLANL